MKKNKLSIKDIASKLNISKTTVSFILNGKAKEKRISDALASKVLKLIDKVGYKPSPFAQSLRTGKTGIIGLMVEDISDPFFAALAKHIEDAAYAGGYKIIFCSTENSKKRAQEFLSMFHSLGVEGYVITPPAGIEDDINKLVDNHEEVVLFDRYLKKVPADYVIINNKESACEGTEHLITQGYKRIAFITLASTQPQMISRLKGYESALKKHNLPGNVLKLTYAADHARHAEEIQTFLEKEKDIDAILFATGYLGICGIDALTRLNIDIPGQIAVVSFDDTTLFRINRPTITVISQPIEKLSETLIRTLLHNIDNRDSAKTKEVQGIVLPAPLIVRESSLKKKVY